MSLPRLTFGALASLVAFGLIACNTRSSEAPASTEPAPSATPAVTPPSARQKFGEPLGQSPSATLAEVLTSPDKFAGQRVTVEGAVRAACTRKGCWMELSESPDAAAPGCRVTFKDYGFFVPTDSAGSKAKVEAQVETKQIKPEMVAHLESEGAKFADKAADGSAREVRLVATGVEMWR
jgi:hypothetical protein